MSDEWIAVSNHDESTWPKVGETVNALYVVWSGSNIILEEYELQFNGFDIAEDNDFGFQGQQLLAWKRKQNK